MPLAFLRSLRFKFLSSEKIKLYTLYAIGEILLVTLGVLLALYVSNRSEVKKANKLEASYLSSLKDEFKLNREEVNKQIEICDRVLGSMNRVITMLGSESETLNDTLLSKELTNVLQFAPQYTPSPGILQELISSGNLTKLKSEKLRILLSAWLINLEKTENEQKAAFGNRESTIAFVLKEVPFIKILVDIGLTERFEFLPTKEYPNDSFDVLKGNIEFESRLAIYSMTIHQLRHIHFKNLNETIDLILKEIDNS